jgi:FixJ family two-component response regulator
VKPITEKVGEDSKLGVRNTVYVVDDEPSVRKALSRLLRSAGLKCEVFASADEFLAHERETPAESGCIVLDVQMPGLNGMELQDVLSAGEGRLPIIFITGHGDIPLSVRAMKKGAVDFLTKPFDDKDLLAAIDVALRKGEEARARYAEITQFRDREQTLTPRERDVMARVVAGLLNKQIAAELGIEEGTVKIHRSRMMQKMGVQSVAELVKMTTGH